MPSETSRAPELEELLEYLKQSRGFDFTGYKRTSLTRRIDKRMHTVGIVGYDAYREYLEANAGEFEELFDTILINVTGFFRDAEAWELVRGEIVPSLVASKDPREPIRVWSAACATGQEAYSLAIVFAEVLGTDGYRDRVRIYGTDIDAAALAAARRARYALQDVEGVRAEIVDKYFERADAHVTLRADLRRSIVFGRNDLIQDPPISRVDFLACRNALMYFDAATQGRIIERFFFALNEGGYMLLGKAEAMLAHTGRFAAVDLKRRIFQKPGRGVITGRRAPHPPPSEGHEPGSTDLRDAALRAGTVPQIVVDRHGRLAFANRLANALFRLGLADVGRSLSDLDVSNQTVRLQPLIEQSHTERRTIVRTGIGWRPCDSCETRWLDVHVVPLYGEDGGCLGTSISFADVTTRRQLQLSLHQTDDELRAACEQLRSTNEELETTNEELRSTVEELDRANEALHSSNEALEAMNAELQSTNEELRTMHDGLRLRGVELDRVNRLPE